MSLLSILNDLIKYSLLSFLAVLTWTEFFATPEIRRLQAWIKRKHIFHDWGEWEEYGENNSQSYRAGVANHVDIVRRCHECGQRQALQIDPDVNAW